MPIYEYKCQLCNKIFDVLQKFSDEPLTKCQECEGKLEKLISAPAFQFKGSGWYITDYKDNKKEKTAEPTTTKVEKDSPKKEKKADDKSASKNINATTK